jgi:hypothetical protein
MSKKWIICFAMLLIVTNSGVFGGLTTYQQWTFNDADNPAAPEISDNPYGTALATITVNGESCGFQPGWCPVFLGHFGVWASMETTVTLVIPNSPVSDGYKDVWLEMLFRTNLLDAEIHSIVTATGANPVVVPGSQVITAMDPGWYKLEAQWRIYPNPQEETIFLRVHDSGADIDYITVRTDCVPEPASLCLLGIGTLIAVYRKRKY